MASAFNKIPMFSKKDYDEWKIRIQAHLSAQDDDMWYVITDGPMKITKINTATAMKNGEPQIVEKKIKNCTTAKEIWEKLTQLCEGNDQTKENKLTVAIQKFDNAKMKPGETMAEFEERFNNIICELISLGKTYSNRETALKVMRAFLRE
ncbi:uncharacterized protein [Henckelia pumila]|uniref:uncharacterized protein n=1 Tax=Henckelia pumila TaxID=405737 RepID=UPI003C6E1D39